jgi:stage II sporulation protein AA (anti-sigma F factor antagonist)
MHCGHKRQDCTQRSNSKIIRKYLVKFMEIETAKEKDTVVVSVKGKIDAVTAPEFEKELANLIDRGENTFLLNFSGLEYISSAGLRSILSTAKQLKPKGGNILFSGLKGPVKDVFKISGFGTIFKIFETREDALK